MRFIARWVAIGSIIVGMASVLPAQAAGGQKRSGTALVPIPRRVGGLMVESCPGFVDANVRFLIGQGTEARFGVKTSTWGKPFTVRPDLSTTDLDISFRTGTTTWKRFAHQRLGGEGGIVPAGAIEAVVCASTGGPSPFNYKAG